MKFVLEPEKFEQYQEIFIKEIIQTIRVKLIESGVEGEKVEEITAFVAFSVASIIDDTTGMESDGVEAHPYLAFRDNDDSEVVVHCGENAYTYELVTKILKEIFES
jgi:hypothetical protein